MKKICTCLLLVAVFFTAQSQTFSGGGGTIPDNGGSATCFPVTVSGVGAINLTHGLASVCLNIVHPWVADLTISIKAPNGEEVILSDQHGGSGDNYTNTCFTSNAVNPIGNFSAPFNGNFIPDQTPGIFNDGRNANGTWYLCIRDNFTSQAGSLTDFSLTFNTAPFTPLVLPSCLNNTPAGDACSTATPICNFNGYCGNTSSSYNIDTWPELTAAYCGSIENNSFLSFVAQNDSIKFNVYVYNSADGSGIQMAVFDGGCGAGPVTMYSCYYQIFPQLTPTLITTTGLTPGNTYYLMIDGFAGDVCDYRIQAIDGFATQTADISYTDSIACASSSTPLLPTLAGAAGGTWSSVPPGLNINPSSGEIIPNLSIANDYTITYTVNATGSCPYQVSDNAFVSIVDPSRFVWTGAVSTAWEDPGNWSCGIVPGSIPDVVINQGTIVISSNVTINSLTLNDAGTNITVTSGWSLTILH